MLRENYNFCPLISEVYFMKFEGSQYTFNGWHPGIVCQNNTGNKYSGSIIAIPLTSKIDRLDIPTNVLLPASEVGLPKTSMALCSSVQVVSKRSIGDFITILPDEFMKKIAAAFICSVPLLAYLNTADIGPIREKAMQLN